jgi:hypothetical protein
MASIKCCKENYAMLDWLCQEFVLEKTGIAASVIHLVSTLFCLK